MTTYGLLDTSVLIALETSRPVDRDRLPDEICVSVVTLGELHAGVLAASADLDVRARRLETIQRLAPFTVIDIDETTSLVWARMRAHLAEAKRRVNVNDMWIAASAAAHRLPVVTQDDDFAPLVGIAGLEVIKV